MTNQIDYSNFTLKQDISENDLAIIVWTFILANVVRNFGFHSSFNTFVDVFIEYITKQQCFVKITFKEYTRIIE